MRRLHSSKKNGRGREGHDLGRDRDCDLAGLAREATLASLDLLLLSGNEELVLGGRDELGLSGPSEELAAKSEGKGQRQLGGDEMKAPSKRLTWCSWA